MNDHEVEDVIQFDDAMRAFVQTCDTHSLDRPCKEFEIMRQTTHEDVVTFHGRFALLVEDIQSQGLPFDETLQWVAFRNEVTRQDELRKKENVNTIPEAVDHVKKTSTAGTKHLHGSGSNTRGMVEITKTRRTLADVSEALSTKPFSA